MSLKSLLGTALVMCLGALLVLSFTGTTFGNGINVNQTATQFGNQVSNATQTKPMSAADQQMAMVLVVAFFVWGGGSGLILVFVKKSKWATLFFYTVVCVVALMGYLAS